MTRGAPVEGFRLAYDREGSGPPVVLLHGWPGSRRGGPGRELIGLVDELGLERPLLAGYDVAQAVARQRPDAVRALVISPPLPGSASASSPRTPSASSGISRCTGSRCPPS